MDKVRLVLTLVTILIVVIPLVGVVLAYQDNLVGLFVPPEMTEMADDFMGGEGIDGSGLEPPRMVGEPEYDEATGTFSISFEYTNSLPLDITINSLDGNIECEDHHFTLGVASLSEAVSIDAGETGILTVVGSWAPSALGDNGHFKTHHGNEETVAVAMTDFSVDISGIQLELDPSEMGMSMDGMEVPNPAFQG